jgi:small-conductance mechanosensitive channel
VSFAARHPRLFEALVSAGILAGSYLAARMLSFLFARVLGRVARRTATTLDDRLVVALERPLTHALVLVGALLAVHRAPLPPAWTQRADAALFVLGVALVTLTLARVYGILLSWYAGRAALGGGDGLAAQFGPLFSKLGRLFIALVGLIAVLQHLGVNVASLVVSLGVGSLAVGLAAQDTLSNMFAGFTLMLDRPFHIGDRIRLATGEVGDVEAIGMRATHIRTLDETILIVPNSLLVRERLVNLTRPGRRITTRIEIGVAYGSDLGLVKRVLAEAVAASQYADHERPPQVLISRFADFTVNYLVVFWARDYVEQGLAQSEVYEEIDRRLREAGIEIPFPTRRIIHEGPAGAAPAADGGD